MDGDLVKKPEAAAGRATPMQEPLTGVTEKDQVKKIAGVKKGMTKTMTDALSIPFFVYQDDYNASEVIKLRKKLKEGGTKLTMLPFFVKAISLALSDYPLMNINVNPETDD